MFKQAVIVAAGRGERLGAAGKLIPKGLMAIGGQHLVRRSLQLLRAAGIEQIIIGTGHLADQYSAAFANDHDVLCVPHDRFTETSSMCTLHAVRRHVQGSFLLLESDILYELRALAELLGRIEETVVLVSQLTYAGDECYVGSDEHGQLTTISKKRADVARLSGELVGISKISAAAYVHMCKYWEENEKTYPKMNYEDALVAVAQSEPVYVHRAEGLVWCEIDTPEHRQRAEELIIPQLKAAAPQGERV